MILARRDPLGLGGAFDLDGGVAKAFAGRRRSISIGAHIVAIVDRAAFPADAGGDLVVKSRAGGIGPAICRQEAQPTRVIGVDRPLLGVNVKADVAGPGFRGDLAAGVATRLIIARAPRRGGQRHACALGAAHVLASEIGRGIVFDRCRARRGREDLGIAERGPAVIGIGGDAILLVGRLGRLGVGLKLTGIVEIGSFGQARAGIAGDRGGLRIAGRHQRGIVALLRTQRLPLLARLVERHLGKRGRTRHNDAEERSQDEIRPHGWALRMLARPTAATRAPGPLPSANCSSAYSTETLPTSRS